MTSNWTNIESAFNHAVDLEPAAQEAFLTELADNNPELAERVRRLLVADRRDNAMLEAPIDQGLEQLAEHTNDRWIGERLGTYQIVERLASGGMGTVFIAKRIDDQYQQRVALKIMSANLLNADAAVRFRNERQMLAVLNHPHIAQLLDGGTTEDGLPYLVLELIDGIPIDEYLEQKKPEHSVRLELFRQICTAVDFAHRNLIVHRDLKPSNILVTKDGRIKLLDFGIAKLLDSSTADSLQTQPDQRAMTLHFASPEQVSGAPISVSTDVYALGVLLYQILTGLSPYGSGLSSRELESAILDLQPLKPSDALTNPSSNKLTATNIQPGVLRGDLDNIVMMAIRKEPANRYESVALLASDIDAYLTNRPVLAHRPSAVYRLKKFIQRNRLPVVFASIGLVSVVTLSLLFNLRLASERDVAQQERDTAQAIADFMIGVFREADPNENPGTEVTARDLLVRGTNKLDRELNDAPLIKARLSTQLAEVNGMLGFYDTAQTLAESALTLYQEHSPEDQLAIAGSLSLRGLSYAYQGKPAKAVDDFAKILSIHHAHYGPTHPATLGSAVNLGNTQSQLSMPQAGYDTCKPYLDVLEQVQDIEARTLIMGCAATALWELGRVNESVELYRDILSLQTDQWGKSHPITLNTMHQLTTPLGLTESGYKESIDILEWVIAERKRTLGDYHYLVIESLYRRFAYYRALGLLDLAEADLNAARQAARNNPTGAKGVTFALRYANNALLLARSNYSDAITGLVQQKSQIEIVPDRSNSRLAMIYDYLARAYNDTGDTTRAEEHALLGIDELQKTYPENHHSIATSYARLCDIYAQTNQSTQALAAGNRALKLVADYDNNSHLFNVIDLVSKCFSSLQQPEPMSKAVVQLSDLARELFGEDSAEYGRVEANQADLHYLNKEYAKALAANQRAADLLRSHIGQHHPKYAVRLYKMALAHRNLDNLPDARALAEDALGLLQAIPGVNHPDTKRAQALVDAL